MFDYNWYIERNHQIAYTRYGNLIDKDKRVAGTNIWFDEFWRYHNGGKSNV